MISKWCDLLVFNLQAGGLTVLIILLLARIPTSIGIALLPACFFFHLTVVKAFFVITGAGIPTG